MSHPVKALIATTDQAFPEGTQAAGFLLRLFAVSDTPPVLAPGEPAPAEVPAYEARAGIEAREVTVDAVAPGTYRATVGLVDEAGAYLADPVESGATITVAEPLPVSFPVPSGLTLTLP